MNKIKKFFKELLVRIRKDLLISLSEIVIRFSRIIVFGVMSLIVGGLCSFSAFLLFEIDDVKNNIKKTNDNNFSRFNSVEGAIKQILEGSVQVLENTSKIEENRNLIEAVDRKVRSVDNRVESIDQKGEGLDFLYYCLDENNYFVGVKKKSLDEESRSKIINDCKEK